MNKIHGQVAMDMVAKDIVQREKYREGILLPKTEASASELLKSVAQEWGARKEEWHQLTISVLLAMPLNGKGGLKDRSGLLEFRYDG